MSGRGVFDLIRPTFIRHAGEPALEIGDRSWTYEALGAESARVAAALGPLERGESVAIFASRTLTAYAGILGTLAAGGAFVPLNPDWPTSRLRGMLVRSGARTIVAEGRCVERLPELLDGAPDCGHVVAPHATVEVRDALKGRTVHDQAGMDEEARLPESSPASPHDRAYVLFTSGTTGEPKGVPVHHGNVRAYLDAMAKCAPIVPGDRSSHFFDLTFDGSVHDLFLAWLGGACLCVVPGHAKVAPAKFIRESRITTWHSVPSVIVMLRKLGMLKDGAFPDLRLSYFIGEALPVDAAAAWRNAAPNSRIENIYGPTECTVAVTTHTWEPGDPERNGIVPIGRPLEGVCCVVVGDDGEVVHGPGVGELLIAGDQVAGAYLDSPEESARKFVPDPEGGEGVHYRTGDIVERDEAGLLYYRGRTDEQVQVRGNRVELQEVDAALRSITGAPVVASVPWPFDALRAEAIHAFIPDDCGITTRDLRAALRARLPNYMVPDKIIRVTEFPLNRNGKLDRRALASLAEA